MVISNSDDRNFMTAEKARRYLSSILAKGHSSPTHLEMQMVVEFAVNPSSSYSEFIAKYKMFNRTAEQLQKMYHDFIRNKLQPCIAIAHNIPLEEARKLKIYKHSIGEVLNRYKVPHPHPMRGEMLKSDVSEIYKYCQYRLPQITTDADRDEFLEGLNGRVQKVVEGIDLLYDFRPEDRDSVG
jgi:hypothetical protein